MHAFKSCSSPNFNDRTLPISGIVVHYTEEELQDTLAIFRDAKRTKRVSAHYVLDRDGTVYSVVPEEKRAWHAGAGSFAGMTDLNNITVGIELVYKPGEKYRKAQIDSLVELCLDIQSRYDIKWVIGHSDSAYGRGKVDPGPHFPWQRLARAGVGIWPAGDHHKSKLTTSRLLAGIGYDVADEKVALAAFALHFCPEAEHDGATVRKCLEDVYAKASGQNQTTWAMHRDADNGEIPRGEKVRVSPRQRKWLRAQLAKQGKEMTQDGVLRSLGLNDKKERHRNAMALFGASKGVDIGKKGDARCCQRHILDMLLDKIGAQYVDFLSADNQTHKDQTKEDFFAIAEKHLADSILEDDKRRIDETLRLIDAVIFTQPRFSVGQLKSIIYSIGEFLHMCRDRIIPPVSAGLQGYEYGWYRLWLWMKQIVSVLRETAGGLKPDPKTGERLGLFIPWCEIICVKMLRHKLFMKSVQKAPSLLLAEIRTTIRRSFLQALCDGAEYYLSFHAIPKAGRLDEIRGSISERDESECRSGALQILELLTVPLASEKLSKIKSLDVVQARIVLALIMENWGRYLCYSSDKGDKELLENLVASAELSAWTRDVAAASFGLKGRTITSSVVFAKLFKHVLSDQEGLKHEVVKRLIPLVSDILFLKARQIDAWKTSDQRLKIREMLQSAYDVGDILTACANERTNCTNIANDKVYGDLARKAGYYARYWLDNQEHFEKLKSNTSGWLMLSKGRDVDNNLVKIIHDLYGKLQLKLPWEYKPGERRGEVLDKLYWDFEMAMWIDYDLRLSSFEPDAHKSGRGWIANRGFYGGCSYGKEDAFKAFAEIVLLYVELTWQGIESSESTMRDLDVCYKWACRKLVCAHDLPRKTKLNQMELLKLTMETFLCFPNDPKGEAETGVYGYQEQGEETSFVTWVKHVLCKSRHSIPDEEDEVLRIFVEVVLTHFLCLLQDVEDNYKDKEWWYLKKLLRRKGEVPYPWHCREEVCRCAEELGCGKIIPKRRILRTRERMLDDGLGAKPPLPVVKITSSGYDKLYRWIMLWRRDLTCKKDVSAALGISAVCGTYLTDSKYDGKVAVEKRESVVKRASHILGVEYSEILEVIADGQTCGGKSVVNDGFYSDSEDCDNGLQRFVRALRNTSSGLQWGVREDMLLYERGLEQYYKNLECQGIVAKRKTSLLFREWQMAKYSSDKILSEIKAMMKTRDGDFYGSPSPERWFSKTKLSGAGDAVNILKLGFVGLEILSQNPKCKIGQEPLRDVVIRCGNQLSSEKPDWNGTAVLKKMILQAGL